jgi:hypothetical protein
MAELEIVEPGSNGEDVFSSIIGKMAFGKRIG